MRGKVLLLIGAAVGAVYATTPDGRKRVIGAQRKIREVWESPRVQKQASYIENKFRRMVPTVDGFDTGAAVPLPSASAVSH